jgi:hypothetical protein
MGTASLQNFASSPDISVVFFQRTFPKYDLNTRFIEINLL